MVGGMPQVRSTAYVDPGWEHGVAQDERKKKVKCNYCGKIVSGGVFRLKQHLARISGEVTHCENVPDEVSVNMKSNLEGCRSSRKRRQVENEQPFLSSDYIRAEGGVSYMHRSKNVIEDKKLVVKLAPLRSLGYVDPGWEHCVAQDEKKKKVKCNYCEKVISGGINRFKQHLARIPGEVAHCEKAPEEVYQKIKENMKWHRTGRRHRKPDTKEVSAFNMLSDNEDEGSEQEDGLFQSTSKDAPASEDKVSDSDTGHNARMRSPGSSSSGAEPPKRSRLDSVFLKSLNSQPLSHCRPSKAKMCLERRNRKDVISAICKFFYHAGIPSDAANSPYFQKMLERVTQYGQGLQGPSSRLISGRFLQEEISNINVSLVEFRAAWVVTGCSIVVDSWNDVHGRTTINFLVSCPRGVHFVSSFDVTDIIDDSANLFKLFDKVVEEVGEENVVQVISRNTPSLRAAGKMLEEKWRNLFWTPCAIDCVDKMVQDLVSIEWVGECLDKAKRITRFIYNNAWLLSFMKREFTEGQELLKPAITGFNTMYFTLQCLLDQRVGLKRMFQSSRWLSSRFSKLDEGKVVEQVVLNATFWKKMQCIRKSLEPIAKIVQKISCDDESRSMPYIYNDMFSAKHVIKTIHGDDVQKYGPFLSAIDNNWKLLFHHPLYVAAYFLNPCHRYRQDFIMNPEVIRGLNECIVRLEADNEKRRIAASMQIPDFVSAKADFGTDLAISTRSELDPAAWWEQHGISCLELQRIAIRILSQTCTSIGCEHTWSILDQVHNKRQNFLSRKKWNDLTYVHYNLRLREQQHGQRADEFISFDSLMLESAAGDWLVESEKPAMQEDEEIICKEVAHFYGDDMDENEGEERTASEMIGSPPMIEPLDDNPPEEDDSLDFLDDDLTD